jgi:hypothetical protein
MVRNAAATRAGVNAVAVGAVLSDNEHAISRGPDGRPASRHSLKERRN